MGASSDDVASLCARLAEGDWFTRKGVVEALARLGTPAALECLEAARDPDLEVQSRINEAIVRLGAPAPEFFEFAELEAFPEEGLLSSQHTQLVADLVRDTLARYRFGLRAGVIDAGQPSRFLLRLKVTDLGGGEKVELLVMRLPTRALVGTWNVRAAGRGKLESRLKVAIPRVVDDAFQDLGAPRTGPPP